MLKAAQCCKVLDAEESTLANVYDDCSSTQSVSISSVDEIAVKSSDGRRDPASCVDRTSRRRDMEKKWRWCHFGVCANLVDLQDLDEDGGGYLVQSGCRIRPVPKT